MKTRTKLLLVCILPATLIVGLMIFLATGDMQTLSKHVADVAVEMIINEELQQTSPEQFKATLYQAGEDKYVELTSKAIPGIIVILILLVASALFLVTRTLKELSFMVSEVKVMSNPDTPLSFRIDTASCKEFLHLAVDINVMMERIEAVFIRVSDMSNTLDDASKSLDQTADTNQINSQSLLSNMDCVAAAMNELLSSSTEIASNVQSAHQEVSDVNSEGQVLSDELQQLNVQLDQLRKVTSTSSHDVGELSHQVQGIFGILQTIQGIAEQTNLLALNAAIEAARAGEQGRGFAVVADEVRNLASKTRQSTEEIAQLISNLSEGADRSVKAMDDSNIATEELATSINVSNEKILALFQRLVSVNDMNTQIAAASEEQSQVIDEISRNAEEARTLSENAYETANVTGGHAKSLGKTSTELTALISGFSFE